MAKECSPAEDLRYPRVLIVTKSLVTSRPGSNPALRNLFRDWPPQNLGQIYSGVEAEGEALCGHTYQIGAKDRGGG